MRCVDKTALLELYLALEKVGEGMSDKRREFHKKAATVLEQELHRAIDSSGLDDSRNTVKGWQTKKVGSGGGYALVRAKGSREGAEVGRDGPGAKTNYTDQGHNIREPSGKAKNYRPRINVPYVKGRNYYRAAQISAEGKIIQQANQLADEIVRELEG